MYGLVEWIYNVKTCELISHERRPRTKIEDRQRLEKTKAHSRHVDGGAGALEGTGGRTDVRTSVGQKESDRVVMRT